MKQRILPFRYLLFTLRADQFILPSAVWALFVIILWIMRDNGSVSSVISGYLGFVLPLLGGILAANAVLDDPTLELQMATPRPAWLVLLERMGFILAFQGLTALTFQLVMGLLGFDLSHLGSLIGRQLAWLIPTLGMMALGNAAAFISASCVAGVLIAGMVWIFETILRGWFVASNWARFLFFFMSASAPGHPFLRWNQASILTLSLALLLTAWALFRRQERYL